MIIIGVDFHPEFQQIASVDTESGEFQEKRLAHRKEAETFYRALAGQKVCVGMEAGGHAQGFERLVAELQFELRIGDAAGIRTKRVRKRKTDRQDAQLILRLLLTFAGGGSIFRIDEKGSFTTIYTFCPKGICSTGAFPYAPLIQASNGGFYGTTSEGGLNNDDCETLHKSGCGTIFEITSAGKLTTLYSFCADGTCDQGFEPTTRLIQSPDGNFYGTTNPVGEINISCPPACGTIFKITPGGKLTTLYNFCVQKNCAEGAYPYAGLTQGMDGNFYGTTAYGGNLSNNCVETCGTVFKITPTGELTMLYSFCTQMNCADGAMPLAGLIQATDGNFYGTTFGGGVARQCDESNYGCGTIFKITPAGKLTTLHTFCADGTCLDGVNPYGGLVQSTSGAFYGTAAYAGTSYTCGLGCGTAFSLAVGLSPFVETRPTSGKLGAAVTILGTNLKGATSVTFNGTAAKFKVISKSEIETDVPSRATSGTVEVKVVKSTLKSNIVFRVTK
jgi:uncharacterized repeat protein (TIGR03803 family)